MFNRKILRFLRITFCLSVLFSTILFPQTNQINFEHITTEQGLSQNIIHSIIQDQKGFLWFATEDGLNRYNGYEFTLFRNDPNDSTTISDNFIWTILEDSEGIIWVGTNNGGLNKYSYETELFTRFNYNPLDPESIGSNSIRCIYEDSNGFLWIGTDGGGVNRFDKKSRKFERFIYKEKSNSLSFNNVRVITEDQNNFLWIGTDGGGLNKFDPVEKTFEVFKSDPKNSASLNNNYVWALLTDNENNIWIGTDGGGVSKYSNGKFEHVRFESENSPNLIDASVTYLYRENDGSIWICTEDGIYNYNKKHDTLAYYVNDPSNSFSLSNNLVRTVIKDRSDIIWIGTVGGGINKISVNYKKIDYLSHKPSNSNSLSSNLIRSIYEDKAGNIWIGTLGGGLNKFNPSAGNFQHFRYNPSYGKGLSNDNITAIFEDRLKNLWIGTWGGGLNKLSADQSLLLSGNDKNSSVSFKYFVNEENDSNSIASNIVQAIFQDKFGNLWVGTENGLDYYIVEEDNFIHFKHDEQQNNSLSDNRVQSNSIIEDSFGNIWIGTWNGLNKIVLPQKFDAKIIRQLEFINFKHNPSDPNSLSDNRIISIYEDVSRNIWIGTHGGGLNRIARSNEHSGETDISFVHYSELDGLPSNVIYGILGDKEGNIWMSTNKGISKFDPVTETFRNYRESDGLQSDQFFYGASYKGKDGRLYFGGINGLNYFFPDELKDNPFVPPVYITNIQLNNRTLKLGENNSPLKKSIFQTKEIELSYEKYIITFEFVALDYNNPDQIVYAYMLEGYDKDWIPSGRKRYATYTDLGHGEYNFKVKGTNSDGIWNEEGASIRIIITPPFWKAWWFIIISLMILFGIVIYIITTQIKNILAVERLRIKIAADLHDNIGSGLTEISILSEVISTRLKDAENDINKSLGMISNKSRDLIDKMSDIVWLVNPKRDSLYDLILRLEDNYSELLSQTNVSFKSENLRSLEKISLSMEHRQHLYLIFKEAINNSITHGECGEINLNAKVKGKTLTMILEDDGIGFDIKNKSLGNGLSNMRERAKIIGGKIQITSTPSKGTKTEFIGNI